MGYQYPAQVPDDVAHLFRQARAGERCVICGRLLTGLVTIIFGDDLPAHNYDECGDNNKENDNGK
jgi:hypothetical protein